MKRLILSMFVVMLILILSGCVSNVEKQRETSYRKVDELLEDNRDFFEMTVNIS